MTIASAITAAQERVANAYTAVETMGGTLPAVQNLTNLPTAINSISTVNNQNKTITENGIYTADTGYTGLGIVTVNCPSGDIVNAKNTTGSSIAEGSKVWLEKKAGGGTRNFTTSGSYTLNDDNGIIVFSNSNGSAGKTFATDFTTPSEYIEVQVKLQEATGRPLSSNTNNGLTEFFRGSNSNGLIRISACTSGSYGGLQYSISGKTSGTLVSPQALKKNTWYWVKIRITDTTITPYWSEDGQTWNQGTVSSSSNLLSYFTNAANVSKYFGVRVQTTSTNGPIGGVADLYETYVKADDTYWWEPYLDTQVGWNIMPYSFSSANSFTGTATENIANSTIGDVKTVLPDEIGVDLYADAENPEISVA